MEKVKEEKKVSEVTKGEKVTKREKVQKGTKVAKKQNVIKRRSLLLSDKVWKKVRIAALNAGISVSEYVEAQLTEKS